MRVPHFAVCFAGVLAASLALGASPAPLDVAAAQQEVTQSYGNAHPEVQEFILHTARSCGPDGLWLNENALSAMTADEKAARVDYLTKLFQEAEYGRHLCSALAEASALKDDKHVPGLMKVAGYQKDNQDY